jgi:hypothetical protein
LIKKKEVIIVILAVFAPHTILMPALYKKSNEKKIPDIQGEISFKTFKG